MTTDVNAADMHRGRSSIVLVTGIVLVVIIAALVGAWWITQGSGRITLRCARRGPNDPIDCELVARGINYIEDIRFWADPSGDMLWEIRIGCTRLDRFRYGELPSCGSSQLAGWKVNQVTPAKGMPRQIRQGERFVIEIEYQYDSMIPPAACVVSEYFSFEVLNDSSIRPVGRVPHRPGLADGI